MCGGYLQEAGFCFHLSPYGEQAVVHVCALKGMGLGPGEWGKVGTLQYYIHIYIVYMYMDHTHTQTCRHVHMYVLTHADVDET